MAAAVTDANTCLRWLTRDEPDLEEARQAASRVVKDAARASDIVFRTRSLFKKDTPQRELVDVNDVIREMIVLLRSEATRYSISVQTELSEGLPKLMADRVQLQQVLINLMNNSIQAMKHVSLPRLLAVTSKWAEKEHRCVSVIATVVIQPTQKTVQLYNVLIHT